LCGDVPYLGTTESPVRLRVDTAPVEPTHERDSKAGPFAGGGGAGVRPGWDVEGCLPGRTAELVATHTGRMAVVRESRAAYGTDEWSLSEAPPRQAVEPLRYARRGEPAGAAPWSRVIVVPLSRSVPEAFRVAWAVAAHRALIRSIGEGAPSLVTGEYPQGAPRPANRVALHLLDRSAPVAGGVGAAGALAILLPDDAAADEVAVLADAVDNLPSVRGPGGRLARVLGRPRVLPGGQFWQPPAPGRMRLWRTEPATVPDTRGSRSSDWSFTQAALLSVGFVWKKQLPPVSGRRDDYYRNLAAATAEAGVAVVSTRPVRTVDVDRYAHRVNPDAVVRPYHACLWLGDVATPTTVAAIGQSRHLGGGLLVPYDVEQKERP
jgi:CRISPR-associated protein Csb2